MNILELNAADLGGAIAHVAASQLYAAMTEDDEDALGPRTWFGSDPDDGVGIEKDVLDMARYVNGRDIPAEQLWRWAGINGIVVNEGDDYQALPVARRLAFEIFTDTCMRSHHRLELAQLDAAKLIPLSEETPVAGLKLEDSIFEPHGSLGDQEPHQAQFLADQAALDQSRLEEAANPTEENEGPGQSAGAPIDEEQRPAAISAGIMERTDNEEEAADQGQVSGGTPAADPGAQGSISELAGDGGTQLEITSEDSAGNAGVAAQGGQADALAEPLADATADAGPADGAHTTMADAAPVSGEGVAEAPAKAKKPTQGKSPARN